MIATTACPTQFLFPTGTDAYEWIEDPLEALKKYIEYFSRQEDLAGHNPHTGEVGIEAGAYSKTINSGETCFTSSVSDSRFPESRCFLEILDKPLSALRNGLTIESNVGQLTTRVCELPVAEYSWETEVREDEKTQPCTFTVRLYTLSFIDENGDTGDEEIQNTIMSLEIKPANTADES